MLEILAFFFPFLYLHASPKHTSENSTKNCQNMERKKYENVLTIFFFSILSESMLRSLVPAVERDKLAANRESSKSVMNSP